MKRVIFDLDGTLLDTLPDIHAVVAEVLAGEGLSSVPIGTVRGFVGRGAPALVDQLVTHLGLEPEDAPRLLERFVAGYESATQLTKPFPGVSEALDALEQAGVALSICTNKPDRPTLAVLDAMGWAGRFDPVIGGDSLPVRKPDPAPLLEALADTDPEHCLFVGDSEVDAETAKRAGLPFALYTEGYRKAAVEALPHTIAFDHFAKLLAFVVDDVRT